MSEERHEKLRTTPLREVFGARLVDVTEDSREDGTSWAVLMFDNGATISFPVGTSEAEAFEVDTLP